MAASFGWNPGNARRPKPPLDRRAKLLLILLGGAAGTLMVGTLMTAWVCDDAWFSLRAAWNLVHGYGLVSNPGERVQAFTSPLWTLLLVLPMVTGLPAYWAALLLSALCAGATVVLVVKRGAPGPGGAALALTLLVCSKAFLDFSSSGLENPLIHLLYLGFLIRWARNPHLHPRVLGLLAGLLLLTRLDLALLVLPHLAVMALGRRGLRALGGLALGLTPLLAWELFSLLYYGSLLPNTAIAKLGDAGLSRGFLIDRGLAYLHEGLAWDPVTVPVIGLGVLLAVFGPRRTTLPTAAGVLLYLGYVVWMGGDFMAGRFLAAPQLGAAFVLAQLPWWKQPSKLALALAPIIAVIALSPRWPLRSATIAQLDPDTHGYTERQVADERLVYLERGGLWARLSRHELLADAVDGPHDLIVFEEVNGYNAFIAGPGCHVVNPYGLSDAFVARLPADPPGQERAGHVTRTIPSAYLDSIRAGDNLLEDPTQRMLLDDLWLATRAPLMAPGRGAAILRLMAVP